MTNTRLSIDDHPLLDAGIFECVWPAPISQLQSPDWLRAMLSPSAEAPLSSNDQVRKEIRNLLRHGGFKPTGRNKPASEYLLKAVGEGFDLAINAPVDLCNVISYHSGLPISVIDLDRATPPLRIAVAEPNSSYVFNPSGQVIDVGGLLCIFDDEGPTANAVKDSMRTKTISETRRTLCVVWGSKSLPGRTEATTSWYKDLSTKLSAEVLHIDS